MSAKIRSDSSRYGCSCNKGSSIARRVAHFHYQIFSNSALPNGKIRWILGSAATEMLLKDQVVKDFLDDMEEMDAGPSPGVSNAATDAVRGTSGWLDSWRESIAKRLFHREPNPFYSRLQLTKAFEELDPADTGQRSRRSD